MMDTLKWLWDNPQYALLAVAAGAVVTFVVEVMSRPRE